MFSVVVSLLFGIAWLLTAEALGYAAIVSPALVGWSAIAVVAWGDLGRLRQWWSRSCYTVAGVAMICAFHETARREGWGGFVVSSVPCWLLMAVLAVVDVRVEVPMPKKLANVKVWLAAGGLTAAFGWTVLVGMLAAWPLALAQWLSVLFIAVLAVRDLPPSAEFVMPREARRFALAVLGFVYGAQFALLAIYLYRNYYRLPVEAAEVGGFALFATMLWLVALVAAWAYWLRGPQSPPTTPDWGARPVGLFSWPGSKQVPVIVGRRLSAEAQALYFADGRPLPTAAPEPAVLLLMPRGAESSGEVLSATIVGSGRIGDGPRTFVAVVEPGDDDAPASGDSAFCLVLDEGEAGKADLHAPRWNPWSHKEPRTLADEFSHPPALAWPAARTTEV